MDNRTIEQVRANEDRLIEKNEQLEEKIKKLQNYYSNLAIVRRQQGRAYQQAKNYILVCKELGIKDIKITLIDSEDKQRINKAIEYIENYDVFKEFNFPLMKRDMENQIKTSINYEFNKSIKENLLKILKGDSNE